MAGVQRGRKRERRAREGREDRTREDRAHSDFRPFLRPATEALPEPANFLILIPLYSFQKNVFTPAPSRQDPVLTILFNKRKEEGRISGFRLDFSK